MADFLAFCDKYRDEPTCIQALADLRWPDRFTCNRCGGRKAYHLAARPRIYECAECGCQHSITAGTVFHKTRTDLRKWFLATYLISHDKRGVSALMISRELAIRYDTAWLMCHKLRHALTESSTNIKLDDFVEIDDAFYGGRKQESNHGPVLTGGKAMVVCAVEKISTAGKKNKGINQKGFIAGAARIAVLPNATAELIGGFIRSNIKLGTWIASDGFERYTNIDEYQHIPMTQEAGVSRGVKMPIVHRLLSNIKTWLNGTYHGVSVKHLPRYLREWSYRFNRRGRIGELDGFLLRRAIGRTTITYAELVGGLKSAGA